MKKVTVVTHQNFIEDVIKSLHESGLVELMDISKEQQNNENEKKNIIVNLDYDKCVNYEERLSKLINILDKVRTKKKGIKAFLNPEIPEVKIIEERILEKLFFYNEKLLNEIEKNILDCENKLHELDEETKKISLYNKQLNYIKSFELDVSYIGESKYLFIKTGITNDIESLKSQIKELEKTIIYLKQFGKGKKVEWAVLIAAHISEKNQVEKICRENINEFNFEQLSGSPYDILKYLDKKKNDIEKEKKQIIKVLNDLSKNYFNELLSLREEIQVEKVRKEISKNFSGTQYTYIIKGWVLENKDEHLKKLVKSISKDNVLYISEKPSVNPDSPPTYYHTPNWAISFKTILEMFGTPKYYEINPMFFAGFFFILFFGFMLGDAGYGLIILFGSLFGYFKLGKNSSFIKGWSFLGIWLGITTTIVGFLTNGFFADLIPRFFYNDPNAPLYNINIMGVQLPIDGIRDPLTLLSVALILALIQLNLGITLGMCQLFKNKHYKTLLFQYGSWIPLEVGGSLLIGSIILDWSIDTIYVNLGIILTLLGILMLFIYTRGPVGFFSITGYVGDWLSYSRLIALGLSTAGMALAINVVGELTLNIPLIGFILFIIVMVFAHIANLGIQSLGAAVHSLRLQYIEFFNRFYEGGGKEFTPFKINRIYTKVKEKN
jgi:V/A-type H+-transporting ATPase subunit I